MRPLHGERHGHPVIFPGDLRDELAAVNDATEGPRAVVRRHAARLRDAPTAYPHVLLNLNTRAAYDAARAAFDLPDPDAPPSPSTTAGHNVGPGAHSSAGRAPQWH